MEKRTPADEASLEYENKVNEIEEVLEILKLQLVDDICDGEVHGETAYEAIRNTLDFIEEMEKENKEDL
jgi:hypothetical protein